MRAKRNGQTGVGPGSEERTDPGDEGIAYAAGASAPPAPPSRGRVEDDREVEFGTPFVPSSVADAMFADESNDPNDVSVRADAATLTGQESAPPNVAVPAAPIGLSTEDGRTVSVVHIVAELAPFARTGGLGEAVKSLAEFQSASGIPTAIIMPLYRQVHAVAPNLEPVGEPFMVQLGPTQEQARLMQITPDRRAKGRNAPRV